MTVNGTPDDTVIFPPYIQDALLNLNANFLPATPQHEPRAALFSQLFIQMRRSSGEGQSRDNPAPLRAFAPSRISSRGSASSRLTSSLSNEAFRPSRIYFISA